MGFRGLNGLSPALDTRKSVLFPFSQNAMILRRENGSENYTHQLNTITAAKGEIISQDHEQIGLMELCLWGICEGMIYTHFQILFLISILIISIKKALFRAGHPKRVVLIFISLLSVCLLHFGACFLPIFPLKNIWQREE